MQPDTNRTRNLGVATPLSRTQTNTTTDQAPSLQERLQAYNKNPLSTATDDGIPASTEPGPDSTTKVLFPPSKTATPISADVTPDTPVVELSRPSSTEGKECIEDDEYDGLDLMADHMSMHDYAMSDILHTPAVTENPDEITSVPTDYQQCQLPHS